MVCTISVIGAGAMGSALAKALTQNGGFRVLTYLEYRSPSTRKRALEAGMHDTKLSNIASSSSIIISVVPPSEAIAVALSLASAASVPMATFAKDIVSQDFQEAGNSTNRMPIFIDANAVSPTTSQKAAELVAEKFRYIDGCIIGGPPTSEYQPTIYLSGADAKALAEAEKTIGSVLRIRVLDGQGVGAASALKLSYAGMTKGFTGLAATMILSAAAHSPATAEALLGELFESQPAFVKTIAATVPGCLPKAYRFVGEFDEIAEYIAASLGSPGAETYRGLAQMYQRLADDVSGGGREAQSLREFAKKAAEKRS